MENITKLQMVINTLDGVKVEGRENWDRLLGSIQTIEAVIRDLTASAKYESAKQEAMNG